MQAIAGALVALSILGSSAQMPGFPSAPAKPAPTGTARLSGRVISAETGKPLRRAVVRVMAAEVREPRSVSTEPDGRWEIKDLPAGKYMVTAQKGGYVPVSYGQRRPFEQGKPVELADGQVVDKLEIALPKGGVISGRIADEFGEPLSGARVSVMRHRFMRGQRMLVPIYEQGGSDTTDDLGQYRLHGLSPGEYYVSSSLSGTPQIDVSADKTGYAGTYYPGTPVVGEAQRVTVSVGLEVNEINFPLVPTRVAKITGTALNSEGKPVVNGAVMLTTTGGATGPTGTPLVGMALTRGDGGFTISNVAPGEYRLEMISAGDLQGIAQRGGMSGLSISESASTPVTMAGQDVSVTLVSRPTATAAGRVVFEGTPPAESAAASTMVFAQPDAPTSLPMGGWTTVKADWTFDVKGLTGKRIFRVNAPAGWFLKVVKVNDTEVTDTAIEFKPGDELHGLEIHLTTTMASLSGAVQDTRGQRATDYVVVLFSSDARKWGSQTRFVRTARPDQSGGFTLKGLPPDDYLAVAVDYLEPGEEGDPELLERWRSAGTAVSIGEGAAKTISLKLYSSMR